MSIQSVSEWQEGMGRRGEKEVGLLTGLFSKWLQFLGEGLGYSAGRRDEVVKNYY